MTPFTPARCPGYRIPMLVQPLPLCADCRRRTDPVIAAGNWTLRPPAAVVPPIKCFSKIDP